MKIRHIFVFLLVLFSNYARSDNMVTAESIAENLPVVIYADIYDAESESKYLKFIECVANGAVDKLSPQELSSFNKELQAFSEKVDQAMGNMELILQSGPPRPSTELIGFIKTLQPIIEGCEKKLGIRVEF